MNTKVVSGIMLTLLIAGVAFLTSNIQPADAYDSSAYAKQASLSEEGIDSRVRIVEHRITTSELERMKQEIGVCEDASNYNQMINGHGTGLRPPTEEEWAQIAANTNVVETVSFGSVSQPPSRVDYSISSWFPPIGNQDGESSCLAWAIGYYMKTFQEAKEHGWNLTNARWEGSYPTPEYQDKIISPAFIYHLTNAGVNGWTYYYPVINLVCSIGACSWAKMPWDSNDQATWPSENAWREAAYYRGAPTGYESMSVSTDDGILDLKNWIASENLAVIGVDANQYSSFTSDDFWTVDNYAGGSNHANTIVGYDDNITYLEGGQLSKGAFEIANSWGVGGWEKVPDGFYWISYKAMMQRIGYIMFYRDRIAYVPTLNTSFRIEHPLRGECGIEVGMGSHDTPNVSKEFTRYIVGGQQPFCPNNIVLDITEFRDVVPTAGGQPFFIRVFDRGTSATGTILYFAIENTVSSDPPEATINEDSVFADLVTPIECTLTASSSHGSPNPSVGDHLYFDGDSITCNVSSPVTENGALWTCSGWNGTGSVPPSGNGISVTFTITEDSSIAWNWELSQTSFQDGFESANFNAWNGTRLSSGETASVVSTRYHHGKYSGRFTSSGGGGTEYAYCYESVAGPTELFVRGYFYVSQSGIIANDNRFHLIMLMAGNTQLAYADWRMSGGFVKWSLVIRDGSNAVWPTAYSAVKPALNRWYCVELHWKKSASGGLGELWVDGTRVCLITGKNTALQGDVNLVRFGLGNLINCRSTTVYSDCARIATTYIGPEPKVNSFTVSPNPFSPNGDGTKDTTTIKTTFNIAVNWNLQVRSSLGVVLRTWTRTGSSLSIVWDGKNSTGFNVPDGFYTIRLSGTDLSGITFTTTSITATVDTKLPTVTGVSVFPNSFNPRIAQTTKINYTLSESCYVTIRVYNSAGTPVRTLVNNVFQTGGAKSITWNGKTSSGTTVPAGTYTIRIYVTDKAGNKATPYPLTKTVRVT